ncbi:ras-related protein Rab-18-like [Artemia franciscana]|uniref:ras-related protein Rab-18-like n=1 Tax=Artemia franciscana TaxID=6661 RepID=UPI0032DB316C
MPKMTSTEETIKEQNLSDAKFSSAYLQSEAMPEIIYEKTVTAHNKNASSEVLVTQNKIEEDFIPTYKIAVIGDVGAGKSSLIERFKNDKFNQEYKHTNIYARVYARIKIDNNPYRLCIWDKDNKVSNLHTCYQCFYGALGAIAVYDVTERSTFENLKDLLFELDHRYSHDHLVKILVATKIDKEGRQVTTEEGAKFARYHSMLFIETSAKTGDGVHLCFETLMKKIRKELRLRLGILDSSEERFTHRPQDAYKIIDENMNNTALPDASVSESSALVLPHKKMAKHLQNSQGIENPMDDSCALAPLHKRKYNKLKVKKVRKSLRCAQFFEVSNLEKKASIYNWRCTFCYGNSQRK